MIRTQEQAPRGSFGYAFDRMQEYLWLKQCDQLRDGLIRHGYAYLDGADPSFTAFLGQTHSVLTHLTHERILQYTIRDLASADGFICIETIAHYGEPFAHGELLTIEQPSTAHAVILQLNMEHPEARLWMHTQRTPDISLIRPSFETIIETGALLLLHEEVGTSTMLSRGDAMSALDALSATSGLSLTE